MAELNRVIGKYAILIITINSILGAGIFFLPAVGAGIAGPGSIISWAILSIIGIFIAMCFGELTSMYPKAGGVYEFSKQAYGPFWSFIVGWITLIAGNITIAMISVGAIRYIIPNEWNIIIPLALIGTSITISMKIIISIGCILFFNYISYKGMQISKMMLVGFGIVTILAMILLIIPGSLRMQSSNFHPFFVFPLANIFLAIFFIAETFFGWESATFLAEETKDGEKVIPYALIWGTVIIGVLSTALVVTSIGAMGAHGFSTTVRPFTDLAILYYGTFGEKIITLFVFTAIIGTVAGWVVSAPRLILGMAEDKLFISGLAKIHPVTKTPYKAIIFQTILSCILILVASGSYETLLYLAIPLDIFMYVAVIFAFIVLRKKKPDQARPYRAPFGQIGAYLILIFFVSLLLFWMIQTPGASDILKIGSSFIILGIPVFFLLIMYYDPEIIIKMNNMFAYLNLTFEKLLISRKVINDLREHLDDISGKKVLEFGCGVGTITKELIKDVGPEGFVYATDISYSSVKIARRRMEKRGHSNVLFIHDIHQVNRVHDSIPKVDVVVSFGMLGYIQDIKKVLREMNRIMPDGGKIIFIDYVDLFKVIPNVSWLSDERKLIELFRECGFSVNVKKETTPMWNYLYVYGMKSNRDVPYV
jgi:basic amino acid/polyamine antiporter, APA family